MSDAYERERQNDSRLSELSAKVTALRGVTVDIYDNARAQDVIDNTVSLSPLSFPSHISVESLVLTALPAVRYLLFHEHLLEGIGRPVGQDGGVGEQGCHFQARGHDHRRCTGAMVHMGPVRLI